jgi:hypothetical protein
MDRTEIIVFGLALLCLSLLITSDQPRGKIAARLLEEFSIEALRAGLFA